MHTNLIYYPFVLKIETKSIIKSFYSFTRLGLGFKQNVGQCPCTSII